MSNVYTMSSIRSHIASYVAENLYNTQANSFEDFADFESAIDDVRDNFDADTLSYTYEAIQVCDNYEFNNVSHEELDFSNCTDWSECAMLQANAIYFAVQNELIDEVINDMKEEAKSFFEYVEENLSDEDHNIANVRLTTSDPYGWAAHDFETRDDIRVHCNLENELFAVCYDLQDYVLYASIDKNKRVV